MASFNGVDFSERGQSAQTYPAWDREADTNLVHIPGGNTTVIQTSGNTADRLVLTIRATGAQIASLYGKVGTTGTLDYSYGSRSAYLQKIDQVVEIFQSDKYFANLHFVGR